MLLALARARRRWPPCSRRVRGRRPGAVDQPARASAIPRLVPPERLPVGHRAQPAQLPAGLDRRPGDRRHPHRHGRAGRRLRGRPRLVHRLARGAARRSTRCRRSASSTAPGLEAIREGLRFARRRRAILGLVRHRPQRDDLRDADVALPGPRPRRVRHRAGGLRAAGRGARGRGVPRRALLGLGLGGRSGSGGRSSSRSSPGAWRSPRSGWSPSSFPLALLCLAVAGAADVFSAVFRSTLVQLETPDELRGRVMSIHILVVTSGPRLGDIEAAVVAAADGPAVRGRLGRRAVRGSASGSSRGWFPELGRHIDRVVRRRATGRSGAVGWLESGHDCDGARSARPPPSGRRSSVAGSPGCTPRSSLGIDPEVARDPRRPAQLPPVPADALPGRDRRPVAGRHRPAAALDPAQAAQHDGHPRRGGRHRPRARARSSCPTAARSRTTRSSSRPARTTPTSATTTGRRSRPGLKTLEDATEIRRRILIAFEAAEREADPERREAWMTFVLVGGGPTGVELAGALGEIARDTLKRDFRSIRSARGPDHPGRGDGSGPAAVPAGSIGVGAAPARAARRRGPDVKTVTGRRPARGRSSA